MRAYITAILFLAIGYLAGNLLGDQATLRECVTVGATDLVGGGTIECKVLKKLDPETPERPTAERTQT